MEQILHVGPVGAADFVRNFVMQGTIALVTGGTSYERCGASHFLTPILPNVVHLRVKSSNPKVDEVQNLLENLRGHKISAFIAVGGGTPIDTAKLLNLAMTHELSIQDLLALREATHALCPLLAIPTTAGTGAEATRFAVCYKGETKHSIDLLQIRPSHVLLMPEFLSSLPRYQKACTNFDAYAQAVESLWANGATQESCQYATRALDLMKQDNWLEGAYWSGRAIDISRTTAAHALSYYLTAHYDVPHGHAVYMVFPYVCRANGHPEFLKSVPELQSLRDFASERGLVWANLVDDLLAHVNAARLSNNPMPITSAAFNMV